MPPTAQYAATRRALDLMARGDLVRRNGGWRFGAATIGDNVVDFLAEAGRVRIDGDRAVLLPRSNDER